MGTCTLNSKALTVTIASIGAELSSIKTSSGQELIWQADPAFWPRHAPLLFPVVGQLREDTLLYKGKNYRLTKHGFVRDMEFSSHQTSATQCQFLLKDNDWTREHFPFAFELLVDYTLLDNALKTTFQVKNPGDEPLLMSIGGHPAFVWPLPGNATKAEHVISFEKAENPPLQRLQDGLLRPEQLPSPVKNGRLTLDDTLFIEDALIFTQLASRSVVYASPGPVNIQVSFPDFPQLGIWTKPGANFICIEPWQGFASPVDFSGDFSAKPGLITINPNEQRQWQFVITIHNA